ncbi:MAG: fumarylacetoacetate hydrolase family protein [Propionibacteriaceae bacterium]|jgi:2-keto-4-pentenoate hydratase/2-oxohepta-3-ene-1,7-dioic acid hydratase in catechol pathway|nr:fumarylacetoacetate hydrolase family protein [Propionibacteriaceae bacterium]
MRIARFQVDGRTVYGEVVGPPGGETVVEWRGDFADGHLDPTGPEHRLADVVLLSPVAPSKVVAVAKNYAAHAREFGAEPPAVPQLFLKPSTAVVGPGQAIRLPAYDDHVDHEAELAVVIGRACRGVAADDVVDYILGYTVANDVSARTAQRAEPQWVRGKAFDTSCPLGPWIETAVRPDRLRVRCWIDGQLRQDGCTADLVHPVPELVAYAASVMTLLPGDVVLTGTPAGVGPLAPGNLVTCAVDGIGELTNPVVRGDGGPAAGDGAGGL